MKLLMPLDMNSVELALHKFFRAAAQHNPPFSKPRPAASVVALKEKEDKESEKKKTRPKL